MISEKQLNEINFFRNSKVHFYSWNNTLMFNTSNHILYLHYSINGDIEEVGKFNNIEVLKKAIYDIYSPNSDIETFFQEEFSL